MELCEMLGIVERLKRNGVISSLKAKAINNAIENGQWRDLCEYGLLLTVPYCEDLEIRNQAKGEQREDSDSDVCVRENNPAGGFRVDQS